MIPHLFFIFLGIAVLGVIAAFVNMACAVNKLGSGGLDGMGKTVILHLVCGLFYVVGAIGTLITGIMWIVTYCKAA